MGTYLWEEGGSHHKNEARGLRAHLLVTSNSPITHLIKELDGQANGLNI